MLMIFDCDGTLIDSELISLEVLSAMMSDLGRPMTVSACLDAFMGLHNRDILAKIERLTGRTLAPDAGARMRERMLARMKVELKPVPGMAGVLAMLKNPRCVASSSTPQRIALTLEWTGLDGFFGPHIFSATQVEHGKPAPDLFLFAAREMGFAPDDCIVIEDSVAGVEAGVSAGMAVIGFTGGSHVEDGHAERLLAAGARIVIPAMSALPEAVAGLRRESGCAAMAGR